MQNILAVDPGLLSGFVYVGVPDNRSDLIVHKTAELYFNDVVDSAGEILAQNTPESLVVIAEKFTITARTAKLSAQPDALWVQGAMKGLMHLHGFDPASLVLQTPANAKNIATNGMIKDVGLWHRGGKGHAQDASRHVLLYLLTHNWKPESVLNSIS